MHRAAREGDRGEVYALIVNGADIDALDEAGWTPLNHALDNGHNEVTKLLINNDCALSMPNKEGWLPLHTAAYKGNIVATQLICKKGCPPDCEDYEGQTALHKAASQGKATVVTYLLMAKADATKGAHNSTTALHCAALGGHTEVVTALLLVDSTLVNQATRDGFTALHCAAASGFVHNVQAILKAKAFVDPRMDGATPLHIATEYGNVEVMQALLDARAGIEARDSREHTPLLLSAVCGKIDVFELLVQRKADLSVKTPSGNTILHHAVRQEQVDLVRHILVREYFPPNVQGVDGCNAAFSLAMSWDMARCLQQYGVSFNFVNAYEMTPLMYVCTAGAEDQAAALAVIRVLIRASADPYFQSAKGITALHIAAQLQWADVCRALLEVGADCDAMTKGGFTPAGFATDPECQAVLMDVQVLPLMQAARGDNMKLLDLVVSHSDSINSHDCRLRTPLMEAVLYNNVEGVRVLLGARADGGAIDCTRHTALLMAYWHESTDVIVELEAYRNVLTQEDSDALNRKRTLQKQDESTLELLRLPTACGDPVLMAHQTPYRASAAALAERAVEEDPVCLEGPVAVRKLSEILPPTYKPEESFMSFMEAACSAVTDPPYKVVLWDAKLFTIEQVARHDVGDPWRVFVLYLYTYPCPIGRRLRKALHRWDEEELRALRPLLHAVYDAVQALPPMPGRKVYKPMAAVPDPLLHRVGATFSWIELVTAFPTRERAAQLAARGCVFEIATSHARDVSLAGLQPEAFELLVPMTSHFRVAGYALNGAAVAAVPHAWSAEDEFVVVLQETRPPYERRYVDPRSRATHFDDILKLLGTTVDDINTPIGFRTERQDAPEFRRYASPLRQGAASPPPPPEIVVPPADGRRQYRSPFKKASTLAVPRYMAPLSAGAGEGALTRSGRGPQGSVRRPPPSGRSPQGSGLCPPPPADAPSKSTGKTTHGYPSPSRRRSTAPPVHSVPDPSTPHCPLQPPGPGALQALPVDAEPSDHSRPRPTEKAHSRGAASRSPLPLPDIAPANPTTAEGATRDDALKVSTAALSGAPPRPMPRRRGRGSTAPGAQPTLRLSGPAPQSLSSLGSDPPGAASWSAGEAAEGLLDDLQRIEGAAAADDIACGQPGHGRGRGGQWGPPAAEGPRAEGVLGRSGATTDRVSGAPAASPAGPKGVKGQRDRSESVLSAGFSALLEMLPADMYPSSPTQQPRAVLSWCPPERRARYTAEGSADGDSLAAKRTGQAPPSVDVSDRSGSTEVVLDKRRARSAPRQRRFVAGAHKRPATKSDP